MEREAIELTKQLVRIDSSNPGKCEEGVFSFLKKYLEDLQIQEIRIQTEEVLPNRNNLMAVLPGKAENPELVFICHMDTVPVGSGWSVDSFDGEIADGKLYGRGACDMKSGLACALAVFANAAKKSREDVPKRTLKFIATADEEGDMAGVEKALQSGWITPGCMVADLEPTDGKIQGDHKGRCWFKIRVNGIAAHASTPWKGEDAVAAMAFVIMAVRRKVASFLPHWKMGNSTAVFGTVHGGTQSYQVPGECTATVDIRLTPPYTSKDAVQAVEEAIAEATREFPKMNGEYQITGDRPYIEMDADSVLLRELQVSCKNVCNGEAAVTTFPGYTDTAVIAGKLGKADCLSYGPGNLERAHKPDEYVPMEDIKRCVAVYADLTDRLLF